MSLLENAEDFIKSIHQERFENLKFSIGDALFTNDAGEQYKLPVFDASDVFTAEPVNMERNESQKEALHVWNKTGMLIIENFLGKYLRMERYVFVICVGLLGGRSIFPN